MASSLFADTLATCLIFSEESPTETACFSKDLTIASTALSIPLFKSRGFAPAATFFRPSLTTA